MGASAKNGRTLLLLLGALCKYRSEATDVRTGQPLSAAVTSLGGSLAGVVAYVAIFFVVLIHFYAFQETARSLAATPFGTCSSALA